MSACLVCGHVYDLLKVYLCLAAVHVHDYEPVVGPECVERVVVVVRGVVGTPGPGGPHGLKKAQIWNGCSVSELYYTEFNSDYKAWCNKRSHML